MTTTAPSVQEFSFLFTDIEGSTRMWEASPESMAGALRRHDQIMRETSESLGGNVFKTVGDAFCVSFESAGSAVLAALAAQETLASERWPERTPIRVRMAVHTGLAEVRDNDYFGQTLNRVARILSAGHGGQTLLSQAAVDAASEWLSGDVALLDLGKHRLKDLGRAETLYQVSRKGLPTDFPRLKSLTDLDRLQNLPVQPTSFVGRRTQLADLTRLLKRSSLLTLLGPGGSGKTRLSIQLAADLLEEWPDGVWFIDLAPVSEGDLIAQTIADVLGIREATGTSVEQKILEQLRPKHLLLILDNCEHLADRCARFASRILSSCPNVQIVATSRQGLGINGEVLYAVPPLTAPGSDPKSAGELADFESVALFCDRARQLNGAFILTEDKAAAVASICVRLDGIPLAIELAAARIRSLTVQEIADRLQDRFRLLTGGSKAALPRQQTLRSLIDWSFDLLPEAEKAVFCRLSVFSGSWLLEAAEKIVAGGDIDEYEVMDLLASLVDKSLVVAEASESQTRYRLLETMREYGSEKLEPDELERLKSRHLDFYLSKARDADQTMKGPRQDGFLEYADAELDNFRSAIEWSCLRRRVEEAQRLTGSLWMYWYYRGHFSEGLSRLERALDLGPGAPAALAMALFAAGSMANNLGKYETARSYASQSLSLAEELRDEELASRCLNGLGRIALTQSDPEGARTFFSRSLGRYRKIGDPWGISLQLTNLASVEHFLGNYPEARRLERECLDVARKGNSLVSIARSLSQLGLYCTLQGDLEAANGYLEEGLRQGRSFGDFASIVCALHGLGIIATEGGELVTARGHLAEAFKTTLRIGHLQGQEYSLRLLGSLAIKEENPTAALELFGVARALRERLAIEIPPAQRARYEADLERAMSGIDAETVMREAASRPIEEALQSLVL